MNLYLGEGVGTADLSYWQTTFGFTRQRFFGVLIWNCFIGVTYWSKSVAPRPTQEPTP